MISTPQHNNTNEEVRLAGIKRDRKGNPITSISSSNPTSTNTTTSPQPSQCSK